MKQFTTQEIYKWLNEQKFQKEQGDQEYWMYFDVDIPKIINLFIEQHHEHTEDSSATEFKPKWIPVSERLPGRYEAVLTYGHPNDGGLGKCICEHADGIFRHQFSEKENKFLITHWQPLPEPPES